MRIGVPKETLPGESRVALIPAAVGPLLKAGLQVAVEQSAGAAAGFTDEAYRAQGASVVSRAEVFQTANVLLQVRAMPPDPALRAGQAVIGFADPLGAPRAIAEVAATGVTMLSMELMPRITRAQSMDALSSMATVAGYKGVLLAANLLPRMFPMLMTAAGTVSPAHVFIVGLSIAATCCSRDALISSGSFTGAVLLCRRHAGDATPARGPAGDRDRTTATGQS